MGRFRSTEHGDIPFTAEEEAEWDRKEAEWRAQESERVKTQIVAATQIRLDDFAKARGYDGILSACTYATSPTPRFAAEGQHAVAMRDATWAKLIEIMDAVVAGTRPMPQSYADIKGELPELVWGDA